MHFLTEQLAFPDHSMANSDGLLAVGGDLSVGRLMLAYKLGIFPWYEEGQPILWWSPELRMVLFPSEFKVSKSLLKIVKSEKFRVTFNTVFSEVIEHCASIKREGQRGTWITKAMKKAYLKLHEQGKAISVEVWFENELVGGLYGVDLPKQKIFCGESMFSSENDASKVGFYHLVSDLKNKNYELIDCQIYTRHMESLGAKEISREEFLNYLRYK